MSIIFSGSELLEVALGIERNGAAFYQALAEKTKNSSARAIYEHLAAEEVKHLKTFQGMLDAVGNYQPPEGYAEEYELYPKSLIDSSVFTDVASARQIAARVSSQVEALFYRYPGGKGFHTFLHRDAEPGKASRPPGYSYYHKPGKGPPEPAFPA
jgi:hypothetical protein